MAITDLLGKYSLAEIVIFIFMVGAALKEGFTLIEWADGKLRSKFKKETDNEKGVNDIKKQINDLSKQLKEVTDGFQGYIEENKTLQENMQKSISVLMESDMADIKSWITAQHHHFCYEKGYIDDYSLDCIEKRYKYYVAEGGNSFIKDLMNDIRALPKVSIANATYTTHHTNDEHK